MLAGISILAPNSPAIYTPPRVAARYFSLAESRGSVQALSTPARAPKLLIAAFPSFRRSILFRASRGWRACTLF